jgi:hypothetical protein
MVPKDYLKINVFSFGSTDHATMIFDKSMDIIRLENHLTSELTCRFLIKMEQKQLNGELCSPNNMNYKYFPQ